MILYDENKLETLKQDDLSRISNLVISEWSGASSTPSTKGFVAKIPLTQRVAIARSDNPKIVVANAFDSSQTYTVQNTGMLEISSLVMGEKLKMILFSDRYNQMINTLIVNDVECTGNGLVTGCENEVYSDVSTCKANSFFSPV